VYYIDQRWLSKNEPELGLGIVEKAESRRVQIYFPLKDVLREYEFEDAPLSRALLHEGAIAKGIDEEVFKVEKIISSDQCVIYEGEGESLHEKDLSSQMDFSAPEQRLLSMDVDHPRHFDLRLSALQAKKRWLTSEVRGLMGGRILLFPHQLYLSHNLEQMHRIRALLADEVGLGKTIEAGLVLHRSLLSGRVERTLIIVPPALTYAWFAELYLRFNLSFRVLDDTMVQEVSEGCGIAIPEIPLLICPKNRLHDIPILEEEWDMVIVDEVHQYQPDTENFDDLKQLCHRTPNILLLSATPDQDGAKAHFDRLKFLDPEAFDSWEEHHDQVKQAKQAAHLLQDLDKNIQPTLELCKELLAPWQPENGWEDFYANDQFEAELTQRLMDRHALGRLMTRNTRKGIGGFPQRCPHLILLKNSDPKKHKKEFLQNQGLEKEFKMAHYENDERLKCLHDISESNPGDKILVLCHHRLKTEAITRGLEATFGIKAAKFHEGMSLLERDRQAAWFQSSEGPTILVSSPLGAEGRNFQRAKHLFLFDQPLMPEALEQWIGRLDRIGQGQEIHLYIPTIEGSLQHRLYLCHEKLNVYSEAYRGSQHTHGKLLESMLDMLQAEPEKFDAWIQELEKQHLSIMSDLELSRDILLEKISYHDETAQHLVEKVETMDDDPELENWMEIAWDHYGIESKKIRHQTYRLQASDAYATPFPGFKESGMAVTFDRLRALRKDDVTFLTWDHPMVRDALDMVISSPMGNASVVKTFHPKVGIIVEAIYIIHNTLSSKLRADRFFPMEPIHLAMNKDGDLVEKTELEQLPYYKVDPNLILSNPKVKDGVHSILSQLKKQVDQHVAALVDSAKQQMNQSYHEGIEHLSYLKQINPNFNTKELDSLISEKRDLEFGLDDVLIQLDSLRLIACYPKK
jgi:ATP-dependent helicase HepA